MLSPLILRAYTIRVLSVHIIYYIRVYKAATSPHDISVHQFQIQILSPLATTNQLVWSIIGT